MEAEKSVALIGKSIDGLQKGISSAPWEKLHRASFTAALEKASEEMGELQKLFKGTIADLEKDPKEGMPDLKPFLAEMGRLQGILEKNLEFERQKKSHAKTVNILESEETPELYSDLEQRILAVLLKARYALERLTIFLHREGLTPITDKSTARQVMEVLNRKEDELQELREKYEAIRKKSYLGYFEEETVADMEQELGELGRKMALSADDLAKNISFNRSQMEYIESSYAELKQKLDTLEEQFTQYSGKADELVKSLKKERDYAKKVVLDIEHETLQLRNTYTREMLNLQESKIAAKREAERKLGADLKRLQRKLDEQSDLAKHFRKVAEEKLKKEHELEEKVKRLTLLCKTKEKHDAVKRQLKKGKRKKK